MILHLDTSAFLKLYLIESESDQVARWIADASALTTSRVTYAEVCAGLAAGHRQKRLSEAELFAACKDLDRFWGEFQLVELNERAAGKLALKHVIRGFDAVHLAAAVEVQAHAEVVFCSFDKRQAAAARAERLKVLPA